MADVRHHLRVHDRRPCGAAGSMQEDDKAAGAVRVRGQRGVLGRGARDPEVSHGQAPVPVCQVRRQRVSLHASGWESNERVLRRVGVLRNIRGDCWHRDIQVLVRHVHGELRGARCQACGSRRGGIGAPRGAGGVRAEEAPGGDDIAAPAVAAGQRAVTGVVAAPDPGAGLVAPCPVQRGPGRRGFGVVHEVREERADRIVKLRDDAVPGGEHHHHARRELLVVVRGTTVAGDGPAVPVGVRRDLHGDGAPEAEVRVHVADDVQLPHVLAALVPADLRVVCAAREVVELAGVA
mmetsp:Transcript_32983/g.84208  ORF Transcript_32983/g.84208 Transcript_32983/m.84208 type:complete len:293 (+) Transcript_32983:909-1787(+)